jgi:hypothetical protein
LAVGASFGLACADDSTATGPRPSDEELLAFYTEFCTHWVECDETSWTTVVECAEYQVAAYDPLPSACLNRVIDYHRCGTELECEMFLNTQNDVTCSPLRDAIADVDCGGMSAP